MNFTKSCIASTLTLLACLHSSSFLLCMFMRLRLSPFAFSTAPRKYTQVPISEESYIEDLETAISARQNLNLPSSPLDVFFPPPWHGTFTEMATCSMQSKGCGTVMSVQTPSQKMPKGAMSVSKCGQQHHLQLTSRPSKAGLGLVSQNGQRSKFSRGTSGLEPDSREVLLALIQLWTRQAKADYGGLSY